METTYDGKMCNYLDLHIEIDHNNKTSTSLYNKVDAFPFKVNRFGYPDSNVSIKVHQATISGQLIRYGRICNSLQAFKNRISQLFTIMFKRGFPKAFLVEQLLRFCSTNKSLLLKFGLFSKTLIVNFILEELNRIQRTVKTNSSVLV